MRITKRQLKRIIRESVGTKPSWQTMFFDAGWIDPEMAEEMGVSEYDLAEYDGMEILGIRATAPGYYDLEMANGKTLYAISTVHIAME